MKQFLTLTFAVLIAAAAALAGSIDGKWVSERKMERDGQSFTIVQTFELKADGAKLTGKMTMNFGGNERSMDIADGKIDGDKFSFSVVMTTPNGEMKTNYSGSIEGEMLKGTAAREGGQGRPFEAKKQ
ncbi:MAG TPA: hypothetical protein DEH78_19175 [Solibacterales bacterium]|nr:hypothetical protein [Bryobacterales bacterium]